MESFVGARVLITGGTKGLGMDMVAAFAARGARVAFSGRADPVHAPDEAVFIRTDMSSAEGCAAFAASAIDTIGGVDIVVNNAGATIPRLEGVLGADDAAWLDNLAINFLSAVRVDAAVLPIMYEQQRGVILNISSAVTLNPPPALLPYAAAKAALSMYTRGLAKEAGPRGVRVNLITPGNVTTPGADTTRGYFTRAGLHGTEAGNTPYPLGREGVPADITEVVLFLASERASWITASDVVIDGGQFQTR